MRESSTDAHNRSKAFKEVHYKEITKALNKLSKPSISKEISCYCDLDYHQVARRLSEMENKGMIRVVGRCVKADGKPLLWAINK